MTLFILNMIWNLYCGFALVTIICVRQNYINHTKWEQFWMLKVHLKVWYMKHFNVHLLHFYYFSPHLQVSCYSNPRNEDQCLIDPLMHLAVHTPQVPFVSRLHFRDRHLHKSIYFCQNQSLWAVFHCVYWQKMWCKHWLL